MLGYLDLYSTCTVFDKSIVRPEHDTAYQFSLAKGPVIADLDGDSDRFVGMSR